jgi:hypothetical protein
MSEIIDRVKSATFEIALSETIKIRLSWSKGKPVWLLMECTVKADEATGAREYWSIVSQQESLKDAIEHLILVRSDMLLEEREGVAYHSLLCLRNDLVGAIQRLENITAGALERENQELRQKLRALDQK